MSEIKWISDRSTRPSDLVDSITGIDSSLSFLDLVILSLLDSAPMTGYVLKKRLAAQYRLKASFGTLYPRLKTFEKKGVLQTSERNGEFASRASGTNYLLTKPGKKLLLEGLQNFERFLEKIKTTSVI
jgi:DNA-binding PadR family transcriptional regulator